MKLARSQTVGHGVRRCPMARPSALPVGGLAPGPARVAVHAALHNEPQPVLPPKEGLLMGLGKTLATAALFAPVLLGATPPPVQAASAPASTAVVAPAARKGLIEQIDPTKATVTQTVQAFLTTDEGIWIIRIACLIGFIYVITRKPDPAPKKDGKANPYGPVTKAWLVSPQGAVPVDPATLPKPPPPSPPGKSPRGGSPTRNKGDGSPEPGVLAVGVTAAALDTFAPLGRFLTSDVVEAVRAASRGSPAAPSPPPPPPPAPPSAPPAMTAEPTATKAATAVAPAAEPEPAAPSPSHDSPAAAASGREGSPQPTTGGVRLAGWAAETSRKGRAASPAPAPGPASQPAAPPTPLALNPVYPPSRPHHPRPVSLSVEFRDRAGSPDREVDPAKASAGAAGSAPVSVLEWTAPVYDAPPLIPALDSAELEAACVSSVVAYNLALATRQPLPALVAGCAAGAAVAAAAAALADGELVSAVVSRNLSDAVAYSMAVAAAAASTVAPPAVLPSPAALHAAEAETGASGLAPPAVVSSTVAAAAANEPAAAAAAAASSDSPAADSREAYEGPEDDVASPGGDGAAAAAAATAADAPQAGAAPQVFVTAHVSPALPPKTGEEAQAAVARWTDMIKSSPETAVEAVAEVRAVAEAMMAEVRSEVEEVSHLQAAEMDSNADAATSELAAATATALRAGQKQQQATRKRSKWLPWSWAWSVKDVPTFLDPIRQLLSLDPPSVRSKYDPLASLKDWTLPSTLPSWDPLSRLHSLVNKGSGSASRSGSRRTPKYDAIAQLVEFVATLPELVESAAWAEASAKDPLRYLIAEAAGRPNSTVLRAFDEAQARAGAAPKPRRKSRWSKYDPLADLFAPEVPLGGRWDEVVAEILALEAVCGPHLKRFSALQVMSVRGGQAFQSALADFKKMAMQEDGAARLQRVHPAIYAWLQSAGNVSLATVASGTKLGPVWGVLLLPRYQPELLAARGALPSFMRESERRHPGLYGLLNRRDPEQALVLLATLASWLVADEVTTSGKPPRALSPGPHSKEDEQAVEEAAELVKSGRAKSVVPRLMPRAAPASAST